MVGKELFPNYLRVVITSIMLFCAPHVLFSEENKQPYNCLDQAFERIEEIENSMLL